MFDGYLFFCVKEAFLWTFSVCSLGENIAANNAYRQREAELSIQRVALQEGPPSSTLDSSSNSSQSVCCLVEKLHSGLEVNPSALQAIQHS